MKDTLKPGLTHRLTFTITDQQTVPEFYPESTLFRAMPRVFATGYMVGLFEWCCTEFLHMHLDPGEGSLGVHVDFSHLAATPPGMTVTVECEVTGVDGKKVSFFVRGHDGVDVIGEGRHERAVVNTEKFNARVADKARAAKAALGATVAEAGNKMQSGGCLCGAVRFTATPADRDVGACHCSMCRRWSAGPFMVRDCGTTLKIEDKANLGAYRSSEWAERGFCKQCGTPLYYRLIEKDTYFVSAEAFDDVTDITFTSQIFIEEKPAYYDFANKTHNMTGAEVFAQFAPGGGEAKG